MNVTRHALLFLIVLGIAGPVAAQAPTPGDAMIEKYLAQETAKLSQKVFDGAKSMEEWQARRPRLKEEYLYMLGLWPVPEKTPLHPTITGTLERDDFVVDRIHFQSKPGLYVTGNLYRPRKFDEKLPAVLYVCGHSNRGKAGNKAAFQDHGMWFASNGYICLVIDTLQLGEIWGVHHGTYGRPFNHLKSYGIADKDQPENRWWWYAAGYTPAGVECWNGIRAIDYLISRPDVDADKIAVTGISGGGAATFWIAAADERVKCAVPVSGMSDLESYVPNKIINGHCDCMFLYNTYQWEWTTIAALVAPRPLLFANSDKDPIFPMDGNRRIIERLRTLYKWYGKPELVDEYVSAGGHAYRPDLRIAIFKWINKHIQGNTGEVKDSADFKLFKDEELRVFARDEDIPKDAINHKIDESFVPRAQVKLPEAGKFEEWKQGLIQQLKDQSFRSFPDKLGPAKDSALIRDKGLALETESGILVALAPAPAAQEGDRAIGLLIASTPTNGTGIEERLRPYEKKLLEQKTEPYLILPRGLFRGTTDWSVKSPPNYVERSHVLLGLPVDQRRVWDIAVAAQTFKKYEKGKTTITVVGAGPSGILAAYAALLEPSISEVVIIDPPASHKDGPYFLNVLRVLDIPEALGMLAPRPLTLINAKDKAFDRTAEIYKLAGAEGKLTRK